MRATILLLAIAVIGCAPPQSSGSRSGSGGGGSTADAGNDNVDDAGNGGVQDAGQQPEQDAGPPPVENGCVERGTGHRLGDKLANLRLQNCNGDWVELHDHCGRVKAQMVLMVAEWCGACTQAMQGLRASEDQYREAGFDVLYVLGELGQGVPATVEACANVARSKGVNPDELLVDPMFETTLGRGWIDYCAPDGRIGLPIQNILDGRTMEFRWSTQCGPENADPNGIINELMSAP